MPTHHDATGHLKAVLQGLSLKAEAGVLVLESADTTMMAVRAGVVSLPAVMLQAVVTLGAEAREGSLIDTVEPAWWEIVELLVRDPNALYQITPRKLEEMIAARCKAEKFDEVVLTPRSGDGGRDVIAVRHGRYSVRILDQVKAYKPGNLVTADEVRALIGVVSMDSAASKGIVTTTSDFAPRIKDDPGIAPLLPTRIELINGSELLTHLRDVADRDKG
jgi:restriction system protein